MIDRARRQAGRVLDLLEPQARMGIPIVFLGTERLVGEWWTTTLRCCPAIGVLP